MRNEGKMKTEKGALIKDRQYDVRVDAFHENGITEGVCPKV